LRIINIIDKLSTRPASSPEKCLLLYAKIAGAQGKTTFRAAQQFIGNQTINN
jgi:hypothetical protein